MVQELPRFVVKNLADQQIGFLLTCLDHIEAVDSHRMRMVFTDGRVSNWFNDQWNISWNHVMPRDHGNAAIDAL